MSYITQMTALLQSWCGKQGGFIWAKYGGATGVAYCAETISCAAAQLGLINKCFVKTDGAGCFARKGVPNGYGKWYLAANVTPKEGDLILYRYGGSYSDTYHSDHVGYVTGVSGGWVTTVEGNVLGDNDDWNNTSVIAVRSHPLSYSSIHGYYRPSYPKDEHTESEEDEMNFKKGDKSDGVLGLKALLNTAYVLGLINNDAGNGNIFDDSTLKSVKEFQTVYKLEVDGIAGNKTMEKLKWAVERKTKDMAANLSKIQKAQKAQIYKNGDWCLGVKAVKALCRLLKDAGLITASCDNKLGWGAGTDKAVSQVKSLINEKNDGVACDNTVEKMYTMLSNIIKGAKSDGTVN